MIGLALGDDKNELLEVHVCHLAAARKKREGLEGGGEGEKAEAPFRRRPSEARA